jgi:thiol-disulfide isomerase/thioredoxin
MLRLVVGLSLSFGLLVSASSAGEFNPVLSIGDAAPDWKDLPGIDGKKYALADFQDRDTVVLFFICNSCDVVAAYEDRILELAKKYGGPNCAFVAVNVNKVPEDNLEAMKKRADEKKYPFVYLFDESQKIAKDYGANWTPEFFILDKARKVVYMGGIDDQSNPQLVKKKYLEPALEAVAKGGKPQQAESAAIGCAIRFEREKRRRPAR